MEAHGIAEMSSYNTKYELCAKLGIPVNASDKEIKNAYKMFALENHPDKGGNPEKMKEMNALMQKYSEDNPGSSSQSQSSSGGSMPSYQPHKPKASSFNYNKTYKEIYMCTCTYCNNPSKISMIIETMNSYPEKWRNININMFLKCVEKSRSNCPLWNNTKKY